jgi:hypothetical protein
VQSVEPLIERWNGSTWSTMPSPNLGQESGLNSVSCITDNSCLAVGEGGSRLNAASLIEQWDGNSWSIVTNPSLGVSSSLQSVSCAGVTSCVAIGTFQRTARNQNLATFIEQWGGASWSVVRTLGGIKSLNAVSCGITTLCVAVGSIGTSTLIFRWNGIKWARMKSPNPLGQTLPNGSFLNGASCVGSGFCIAVGVSDLDTLVEQWEAAPA